MKKIIALAVAAVVAAPAMADLTISASVENDTTFTSSVNTNTTDVNVSFAGMTKAESGAYISAKGDMRLESETTGVNARDRWVELGTDAGNIRLGAFEGVDGFNAGKDTYVALTTGAQATAANVYTGNSLRGRNNGNQFAVNGNLGMATVQLMGVFTPADDTLSLRPAVSVDLGMATLTAVYEDNASATAADGYALKAATTLGGVNLGVSYAANDAANEVSTTSLTAGMGGFGAGVYMHNIDDNIKNEETRIFVAYTLSNVMGVDGANVTVAASNASNDATAVKDVTGARVRINYAF